jgi:K+-transporting ATPase ATPase C chain
MSKDIISGLRPAFVLTILFALLLGIVYPLGMTGIGQALFPRQANGSLVVAGGKAIGSSVVGQAFVGDRYFQTRPSAAGKGYDGLASSGSNLGPTSKALVDRITPDVAKQHVDGTTAPVPADMVTASGSGLDPDISPDNALRQIRRVARVRGVPVERLEALVKAHVETPMFGILGDPHVNVLALNRDLDAGGAAR